MKVLIFLFIISSFFNCKSQTVINNRFNFGIHNGLKSSDNYRVYQDLDRYIWIVSPFGITKFNGSNAKYFTVREGLDDNDVWEMQIDNNNRKWLTGFTSLIQFIENDRIYTVENTVTNAKLYYSGHVRDTVFFLSERSSTIKRFYVNSKNKLVEYKNEILKNHIVIGDFKTDGYYILYDRVDNKLIHYNTNTKKKLNLETSLFYPNCHGYRQSKYLIDRKSNNLQIYIINKNGIQRTLINSDGNQNDRNKIIFDDKTSSFFIKNNNKISAYKNLEKKVRFTEIENLINLNYLYKNKIGHIFIDDESNTWVTESRGEISMFNESDMSRYKFSSLEKITQSISFVQLVKTDKKIYCRTVDNRILSVKKNSLEIELEFVSNAAIRKIEVFNNYLYVLNNTGLYRYRIIKSHNNESVEWNKPKKLYSSEWDVLTFCFLNDSLILNGNGKIYNLLGEKQSTVIPIPKNIKEIIVYNNRVVFYNNKKLLYFNLKNSRIKEIFIKNILNIEKTNESIVISTENNGIYRLNKEFKISNIPFWTEIIKAQKIKNYWLIASRDQLYKKNTVSDNHGLSSTISVIDAKNERFTILDYISDSNFIYIGTTKGLELINIKSLDALQKKTIRYNFANLNINGLKNTSILQPLSYNQNNLSFKFEVISYFNLGKYTFRSKLKGLDSKWKYTNSNNINFSNLQPGKYTLIVEISKSIHEPFNNQKEINFVINQPYYKEWSFIISIVLLFLIFSALFGIIVKNVIEKKNEIKMKMIKLEIKTLRSQLNPHFIFNALNTIQGYVLLKTELEVNNYISAFAKLMRKILDIDRSESTSLKEEIEFIQDYIYLENLQFTSPVKLSLEIGENVQLEKVEIPTMILQPIIENSLLHAFPTNEIDKKIDISIHIKSNYLIISITDNGIGREKSNELNSHKMHKSHSSEILQERELLTNLLSKNSIRIKVSDLKLNGKAIGTKVIISISLKLKG